MKLCDFEKDVIRLAAGLPQDSIKAWGAGLGASLGPLYNNGYLGRRINGDTLEYYVTEKGLEAIRKDTP